MAVPWFALVLAGVSARVIPLGKRTISAAPRSRVAWRLEKEGGLGNHTIPANGAVWPTAIYWCNVSVGSPGEVFPVAIDSGSGDLDIAGAGCDGCVTTAPNNQYDASNSSTSKRAFPYRFSNTYQTCDLTDPTATCTIAGSLYSDEVSLAGYPPVRVTFGSIESQTSNFDQFKEIDGVIGFTGGGSQNVFQALVSAGECDDIWGMCMYEGSVSNGTLVVGEVDERLAAGDILYVPNTGVGYDAVKVDSLLLSGDTSIDVSADAILDTGTNVLLLPDSLITQLQDSMCADADIADTCNDLWAGDCIDLDDDEIDAFPPLSIVLDGGVSLNMTSRDYILRGSPLASAASQYCIGIRSGGTAGGSGFLIGDTTMRNYYLIFDGVNSRVGWAPVNTDTCGSL